MIDVRRRGVLALFFAGLSAVLGCTQVSREDPRPPPDDSAISTRVKAALNADPGVRAYAINVDTTGGVVRLSGFVDSRLEADQALAVARSVGGVKGVRDDLTIIRRGPTRK